MTDSALQATRRRRAEQVEAALTRWVADPRLAPLTASPGTILLVLDMEGQWILHGSETAASLRAAIADSDGRVFAKLGLAAQVSRLGSSSERPRLARLRLDSRGIAPPVTCLVACAPLDEGEAALLIAPVGPLPALRPPPEPAIRAEIAREPGPGSAPTVIPAEAIVPLSSRLIWRSDGKGILTSVSGASRDVIDSLEGRTWMALCSTGLAPGSETAFNAVTERRTFRGLCLILDVSGTGDEVEIEFSGAPAGRPSQPFSGFGGFGTVRERRTRGPARTGTESSARQPPEEPRASAPGPGRLEQAVAPLPPSDAAPAPQVAPAPSEPPLAAEPVERADLSSNEHDAFREIARALGARFAGDDEPPNPDDAAGERPLASVTPFPIEAATAPARNDGFDSTVAGALDRLPTGVLIHDGGAVLFVNRWLLEVTGHPDASAIEAAGWLTSPTTGPDSLRKDRTITMATASGRGIALQVEQSNIEWQGRPAVIVLARTIEAGWSDVSGISGDETRARRGFVTLDAAGRVLTLDRRAAALVAAGRDDVVGEPFVDLFPPENAARIEESLRQARERAASEPREIEGGAGGMPMPLSLRVARLLSPGETAYRATLEQVADARRDLDEQREIARSAEASTRQKFDFVARAGQAIRAPISGILNIADAMLDEQFGPLGSDRYREYLYDIHGSGTEALALVNDLVDLAQVDAGRIDLAFTDVPLNEIVSGCIASIQPQAARERVVVRTSLSPDLKTLVADERSMRQATMAVIANAVRLSEPGGQVIVTTTVADRGDIALRVRDTGAGMSTEEIEQALDPFRRDGRVGSHVTTGGGLGLTLSKALVEANRGRFTMTSRKNEGTLIEFVFPGPHARTA